MNVRKPLILLGIILAATTSLFIGYSSLGEIPLANEHTRISSGYVVHLDPVTGELTSSPAQPLSLIMDETLQNAFITSSQGLKEESSPIEGGGVMVDLQGRFQNVFIASMGDSSRITATCTSGVQQRHREGGGRQ